MSCCVLTSCKGIPHGIVRIVIVDFWSAVPPVSKIQLEQAIVAHEPQVRNSTTSPRTGKWSCQWFFIKAY